MELPARNRSISVDYDTGETILTFATKRRPIDVQAEWSELKDKDLDLKVSVHRNKRSLDANAYFHLLVGKIADKLTLSKAEVKNDLITSYGQPLLIDDAPAVIKTQIPIEFMRKQESMHCLPCGFKEENGLELTFYRVYRGSHTYDTKEMSILIDGTVQEAKAIGIETMSPEELERLMQRYEVSSTRK